MFLRSSATLHHASASVSGRPTTQLITSRPQLRCSRRSSFVARAVWDESMTLADLRNQLEAALKVEDYKAAAKLRDAIQQKSIDAKLAVEDANEKFYSAFRSGDIKLMDAVWGEGDHVQVVHPGASCIAGREAVMDSWKAVLKNIRPRAFRISLEDVRVYASDGQGYVTCVEVMDADDSKGRIVATNIFEKQNGKWVITMHHGSVAPFIMRR
eukprot:CAMPEP_0202867756 /NCGR_PEP_ID=MMETSP1391-20130828/9606_1 /ASSEMBLY_ACC=CAM_ASM_000867 /TAXON_ID=1034604 /ORGANISM="Chlamydomonas leiostraca, Strain SAG 11-49" /LENGTH=211 /DNA_ID=CAMNT_0049547819 /DNA_START=20 /DNA_END=655 /DNA_ORIENTATION=+